MSVVEVSTDGPVGRLVINRPDVMNAVSPEVLQGFHDGLDQLEEAGVRVCIITGAGDRAFSAGADLAEMLEFTEEQARASLEEGTRMLGRLETGPFVTIAAINGWALGGGTEIALACDIRLASPKARLGLPEVKVGIFPGWGGVVRLPRAAPLSLALDMILSGRIIDAEEAFRAGLVSEVAEDVGAAADAAAARLLEAGPEAQALARRVVRETIDLPVAEAHELSIDRWMTLVGSPERVEGHRAFIEKRQASWIAGDRV